MNPLDQISNTLEQIDSEIIKLRIKREKVLLEVEERYGDQIPFEEFILFLAKNIGRVTTIKLLLRYWGDFWGVRECKMYVDNLLEKENGR